MPKNTKAPDDAHRGTLHTEPPLFPEPTGAIPRNVAPPEATHLPIIQWASGRGEARGQGQSRFTGFIGFHSEVGKDELLDEACAAAGIPQIEIRHRNSGIKAHWAFGERLAIFVVTSGPPARTVSACVRQFARLTAEAGIGLSWPAGEKSRMAVRGYIVPGQTPVAVQLAVRSTMTNALLAALLQHLEDCQTADSLVDRAIHPALIACHELAMVLIAGTETSVGNEETTLITPFIAQPMEATKEAVVQRWRSKAVNVAAINDWAGIAAWADGYALGTTNGDSHLQEE